MYRRHICIVDDDDAVRDSLTTLLEAAGYRAHSHASAEAFLEDCNGHNLLCVLIDVHMPKMSGLDMLETLRKRGVHVPAIVITAAANDGLRRRAARLDAHLLIEKPIVSEVLLDAIDGLSAQ